MLRTQLARHGGLQKGGSCDIVFDQQSKLQDPRDAAIERQMRAMHQLVQAWPVAERGELEAAEVASCGISLDGGCRPHGSPAGIPH